MTTQLPFMKWAFPVLLLIVLIEALYLMRVRRQSYAWRQSLSSIAIAVGHKLTGLASAALLVGAYGWVWQHRLFTIDVRHWQGIAMLFVGVEFCYYWHHRISHQSRWFWATHSVHHSPQQLNLSGAYRLGWTGTISSVGLFYVPLMLLGFPPIAVFTMLGLNLLYQFWLHTELVPPLGWLEKIINTPSNHRVHHAVNPRYLDTNFGGVVMVFDHLFGSYQAERADDPCRYGLVHQIDSANPLVVLFHEWRAIGRDLRNSRSLSQLVGYLFGPPGWNPAGSGSTSRVLKSAITLPVGASASAGRAVRSTDAAARPAAARSP